MKSLTPPDPPAAVGDTYTSRQVTITAEQWDGTIEHGRRIIDWAKNAVIRWTNETPQRLVIETPEGDMKVSTTDWVIRGTEGEFYPCKDSVFQREYHRTRITSGRSSIMLQPHEYAENTVELHHFTGKLLLGMDDAQVLFDQLAYLLGKEAVNG